MEDHLPILALAKRHNTLYVAEEHQEILVDAYAAEVLSNLFERAERMWASRCLQLYVELESS
jgi:hypothetical protein